MKINSITLTDYRNHTGEHKFDFLPGINLLLGKNGAGKSSILEALGLALFNAGTRDNLRDAVNFNTKTATILIEFEGNDENIYEVEKKIGTNSNLKLRLKGEKYERQSTESTEKKIRELCGINSNSESIFKNVISAYQNQLTGIFLDTPTKRTNTFNQIFDTQIYRDIVDGYAKKAVEKYQLSKRDTETILNENKLNLKDENELKIDYSEIEKNKIACQEQLSGVNKNITELEIDKNKLIELKNNIDQAKNNLKNVTLLLEKENFTLNEATLRLEESKAAIQVVYESEKGYNTYIDISNKIREISSIITSLERKDKENSDFQKQVNIYESEKVRLTEAVRKDSENRIEKLISESKLKQEIQSTNDEILKKQKKILIVNSDLQDISHKFSELNEIINGIKNYSVSLSNDKVRLDEKKMNLLNISDIETSIKEMEEILELLSKKQFKKQKVEGSISSVKARIKDNDEAADQLKTGICPFLKEQCQNISSGSSEKDYFINKAKILQSELSELNSELQDFSTIDRERDDAQKELGAIRLNKAKTEKNLLDVQVLEAKITETEKNVEIANLKFTNFLNNFKDSEFYKDGIRDFDSVSEYLTNEINLKISQKDTLSHLIDSDKVKLINLETEDKKLIKFISQLDININESEIKIGDYEKKAKELKSKIDILILEIEPLEQLRKQRRDHNAIQEENKIYYNNYIKYKVKADELEKNKEAILIIEKSMKNFQNEYLEINEELQNMMTNFSEDKFDEILNSHKILQIERDGLNKKIATFEHQLIEKFKEIESNLILKKKTLDLEERISIYLKKLELAEMFRDKLKSTGKLVASRMLEKIQNMATESYRRISNRNDKILWVNNDSDSYQVILDNSTNRRKFEQLSGGEQVSVAIALRSAMASYLTKTNFAIFDEPTNNLDSERKSALSESLTEILKNLKQAIIVTHDESFREMASNVIRV
ncbi:MAG: SMC family ATPase [Candidatus Kapabacteria bacterium]|nr:SMC family ATPase [Candidatus Kapabacteria bacterium]